jgi:hypothetical protein
VARAGRVELAVRRDLRAFGELKGSGRETLGELALVLARQIDSRGAEGPTTTAKLVQELRSMMQALRRVDGDGDDGGEVEQLPAPAVPAVVRDGTVAGA